MTTAGEGVLIYFIRYFAMYYNRVGIVLVGVEGDVVLRLQRECFCTYVAGLNGNSKRRSIARVCGVR